MNQLLAYLEPQASLSRLEDIVIRKLVQRLYKESDVHGRVVRRGEEVVPDTRTATTCLELMHVDALSMGEGVQIRNDKPTSRMTPTSTSPAIRLGMPPNEVLQDEKKQASSQAATAGGKTAAQKSPEQTPTPSDKTVKEEHLGQNPNPNSNSIPLLEYMGRTENEQSYRFGIKLMQKQGWALGEGLGPQGRGIREFLQPAQKVEHSKQNDRVSLLSNEAEPVDIGRNRQSSRGYIHKDTVATPHGKGYDVTSTPRYTSNASTGYGETEWQSGFPVDP